MSGLQKRSKSSCAENVFHRAPLQETAQIAAGGAQASSEADSGSPKSASSGDSGARGRDRASSERDAAGGVLNSVLTADRLAWAAQNIMQVRRVSKQWSKEVGRVVGETLEKSSEATEWMVEKSSEALETADQRLGVRDWAEKNGIMAQAQAVNSKIGEVSQAVNDKFGGARSSRERPSGLSNMVNPGKKEQFWNTLNKMVVNKISALGPPRKLMTALDPTGLCYIDVVQYPGAKGLVALTIDDAPCHVPDADECLLEEVGMLLNQYSAKATFFLCTDFVAGHEDALVALLQSGHEVANHGGADRSYSGETEESFEEQFLESERICDDLRRRAGVTRGGRPALGSEGTESLSTLPTVRVAAPVYVVPRPSPATSALSSRHPSMAAMATPVVSPMPSPTGRAARRAPDSELQVQDLSAAGVRKASWPTSPAAPATASSGYPAATGAACPSSSSAAIPVFKVASAGSLSTDTGAPSATGTVVSTAVPARVAASTSTSAPRPVALGMSASIPASSSSAAAAPEAASAAAAADTNATRVAPTTATRLPSSVHAPASAAPASAAPTAPAPALVPAPAVPAPAAAPAAGASSSSSSAPAGATSSLSGGPAAQAKRQSGPVQVKMAPVNSAPRASSAGQMASVRTAPGHTQSASKSLTPAQAQAFLGSRPVAKDESDSDAEDGKPRWVRHGSRHKWFRAPHADCSPAMQEVLRKHGFTNVLCDSFANDTIITDASFIAETLTELIDHQGGSIVVIHTPEKSFRQHNLEAIRIFLEKMQELQLRVVSVSELVDSALATGPSKDG